VLACLYRNQRVPPEHLQGSLRDTTLPVLLRAMPPDHVHKSVDFWGVMDNELRASLTWVVTVPLDVFAPISGPAVLTKEILVGPRDEAERRQMFQVAGFAYRAGEPAETLAGIPVSVVGSGLATVTDSDGRFTFSGITP